MIGDVLIGLLNGKYRVDLRFWIAELIGLATRLKTTWLDWITIRTIDKRLDKKTLQCWFSSGFLIWEKMIGKITDLADIYGFTDRKIFVGLRLIDYKVLA